MPDALASWRHWILGEDGRTPVEAGFDDHMAWMQRVGGVSVKVGIDEVDGTTVSTAFISTTANPAGGPARWHFETLLSDADGMRVADRYMTWDEAEEGHAAVLAALSAPRPH